MTERDAFAPQTPCIKCGIKASSVLCHRCWKELRK